MGILHHVGFKDNNAKTLGTMFVWQWGGKVTWSMHFGCYAPHFLLTTCPNEAFKDFELVTLNMQFDIKFFKFVNTVCGPTIGGGSPNFHLTRDSNDGCVQSDPNGGDLLPKEFLHYMLSLSVNLH